MPEPPHLAPLDAEEQPVYSELPPENHFNVGEKQKQARNISVFLLSLSWKIGGFNFKSALRKVFLASEWFLGSDINLVPKLDEHLSHRGHILCSGGGKRKQSECGAEALEEKTESALSGPSAGERK